MAYSFTDKEMTDIITAADRGSDGSDLPADLLQRFWLYCKDYNFPFPFNAANIRVG